MYIVRLRYMYGAKTTPNIVLGYLDTFQLLLAFIPVLHLNLSFHWHQSTWYRIKYYNELSWFTVPNLHTMENLEKIQVTGILYLKCLAMGAAQLILTHYPIVIAYCLRATKGSPSIPRNNVTDLNEQVNKIRYIIGHTLHTLLFLGSKKSAPVQRFMVRLLFCLVRIMCLYVHGQRSW